MRTFGMAVVLTTVAGLLAIVAFGQEPAASVVRAQRFEIVDSAGRPRAVLKMLSKTAAIEIMDENGDLSARLSEDGLALWGRGKKGIATVQLSVASGRAPTLSFQNAPRDAAFNVMLDDNGPRMSMHVDKGRRIWKAP